MGEATRKSHLVGHHHHGHSADRQCRHDIQHLIDHFRIKRGCFVSDLSSGFAKELIEFRALLEPQLAGWAIDRLTENDLEQARRIMKKIDKTAALLNGCYLQPSSIR
ncbi:MAG: FCD domain-containing protein [Methylobacteriaceae bacterium]|nr:FCD domain-containing protein [Methylobacteriaceae bacterium]